MNFNSSARNRIQPQILALTETCKKIRDESLPIFYESNDFVAVVCDLAHMAQFMERRSRGYQGLSPAFLEWLEGIGYENAACIRKLELQATLHSPYVSPDSAWHLGRVVRFFAGSGAQASLRVEVGIGYKEPLVFSLFLTDLEAAKLRVHATSRERERSWLQSYQDGHIDQETLDFFSNSNECYDFVVKSFMGEVQQWVEHLQSGHSVFDQELSLFDQELSLFDQKLSIFDLMEVQRPQESVTVASEMRAG